MVKWGDTFSQSQRRQLAILILALLIGLAVYYFFSPTSQTRQDDSATLSATTKAEIEHSLQLGVIHEQKSSDELLRKYNDTDIANMSPRNEDIEPYDEKTENAESVTKDDEVTTAKQAPVIPPTPAGYYYIAATPPANDKYDFGEWSAKPVSVTEITGKRQKIAEGERLYKRVIVKRPDPFGSPATVDDISSGVVN